MKTMLVFGISGQDSISLTRLFLGKGRRNVAVGRASPARTASRLGWKAVMHPAGVAQAMVEREMRQPLRENIAS